MVSGTLLVAEVKYKKYIQVIQYLLSRAKNIGTELRQNALWHTWQYRKLMNEVALLLGWSLSAMKNIGLFLDTARIYPGVF
jgi:hypothetical protein